MSEISRTSFRRKGLGLEASNGREELDYSLPDGVETGQIRQLKNAAAYEEQMAGLGWQVELEDGVDGQAFKSRYVLRKPSLGINDRYEGRNLTAAGIFDHGQHIIDGWSVRYTDVNEIDDRPGSDQGNYKWIEIKFEGYPTEETHDILGRIGPAFDNRSIFKRLGWTAQNRQRRAR